MQKMPNDNGYVNLALLEVLSPTNSGILGKDRQSKVLFHIICPPHHRMKVMDELMKAKAQGPNAPAIDWSFMSETAKKA